MFSWLNCSSEVKSRTAPDNQAPDAKTGIDPLIPASYERSGYIWEVETRKRRFEVVPSNGEFIPIGSEVSDIKTTLENLCSELSSSVYDDGVDRDSLIVTLGDIYKWIVVDPDITISLPAISSNPEDRFRFVFPESARVSSRKHRGPSSVSSNNPANLPKSARKLSEHYTRSWSSASSSDVEDLDISTCRRRPPTHWEKFIVDLFDRCSSSTIFIDEAAINREKSDREKRTTSGRISWKSWWSTQPEHSQNSIQGHFHS